MSMCTRQSIEPAVLDRNDGDADTDTDITDLDASDIDGWYTKSEEEWRGPHDSKDAAYPPKCKTVAECPKDCASTDITTDPSADDDVDDDLDVAGRLKFRRFRF